MNGRVALDSNGYVDAVAGVSTLVRLLDAADEVCIPAPVVGEILFGALNSSRPADNLKTAREFIEHCLVLPIGEDTAQRYADVRFALKQAGRPLPENDIWIAAAYLEHRLPLLTRDAHFGAVAGLDVRGWSES